MAWVNEIVTIKYKKASEMIQLNKQTDDEKYLLTQIVTRTLNELGAGLWGTNRLWGKKYLIHNYKNSWALLQIEKTNILSGRYRILNRIEVYVEKMNRFKIEHTFSRSKVTYTPAVCHDLSEGSLQKGLIEICSKI